MKRSRGDEETGPPTKKKPSSFGAWQQVLYNAMKNEKLRVFADEQVVVIRDEYPKAKHHFLVLPKAQKVDGLQQLKAEHVPLLQHMEAVGREIAAKHGSDAGTEFRFGYHGIPSLSPLHMHAISMDYDSAFLKTKKHWNSFTTDFFRDSADVIAELKDGGKVVIDRARYEQLLKQALKCHRCRAEFATLPKLKLHIVKCNSRKKSP